MLPENIFENQFPSINNAYMSTILERNKELSKCCTFQNKMTYPIYTVGKKQTDGDTDEPPITLEEKYCSCETPLYSGTVSGGLTWKICENTKTLCISGNGTMPNNISGAWKDYYDEFDKIIISNGITLIGSYSFLACTSLVDITIPDSVITIKNNAFSGCSSLVEITIPDSVTTIESAVFVNCIGLVEIVIPNSVTTMGSDILNACRNLISVTIGNSVTTIGTQAFRYCYKLQKITNQSLTPQTINPNVFSDINKTTCVLEVPTESLSLYQSIDVWKDFTNIIGI